MYEKRYGLARRPFPSTPDAEFFYPATGHEVSLANLTRGLDDEEGLLLLVGGAGTGKSLLARVILERLDESWTTALVTNTHLVDRLSLYQALLFDLGLCHDGVAEQPLRLRLTDFALEQCRAGRRTLVVVDEAQHLSIDLLEELRLLANLEGPRGKAIQFLLIGQPPVLSTLQRVELTSLNQRLAVRSALSPMDVDESFDYILHHLRQAGGKVESIIEETAIQSLARGCHGIPRLINQAGHQALYLADQGELPRVDEEAVAEALSVLGLVDDAESDDQPSIKERKDASIHPIQLDHLESGKDASARKPRKSA